MVRQTYPDIADDIFQLENVTVCDHDDPTKTTEIDDITVSISREMNGNIRLSGIYDMQALQVFEKLYGKSTLSMCESKDIRIGGDDKITCHHVFMSLKLSIDASIVFDVMIGEPDSKLTSHHEEHYFYFVKISSPFLNNGNPNKLTIRNISLEISNDSGNNTRMMQSVCHLHVPSRIQLLYPKSLLVSPLLSDF